MTDWTQTARRMQGPLPVIVAEPAGELRGTLLLLHGRNGAPDQPHIAAMADAYLARGWRVAAPELPNSAALPQSGPQSELTFSGHVLAAMRVQDWVRAEWPDAPHALAGHSIGGYAVPHLACDDTHHVLAMSPPLSGQVLLRARRAMGQAALDEVARDAPAYLAEMATADAAPALARMRAPLAVVTGVCDGLVPLVDARDYFMAAPDGRFFGALPGEHHCPAGPACARMLDVALAALDA